MSADTHSSKPKSRWAWLIPSRGDARHGLAE